MSRIRANNIVNGAGTGAPTFPNGAVINGISTITADVTLNTAQLNGTDADFSGIGTYGVVSLGTGTSISSPSNNVLALGTNDTEALRITANGDTQVSSGSSLYIANGNLVFSTAGTGIDFSATADGSGTMTSEVLDDYEEGDFTPGLDYETSGTSSFSYQPQTNGHYIKVGRIVHCRLEIRLIAFTKGTASGHLQVTGLPFTSADYTWGQFVGNFSSFNAPLPTGGGETPVFIALLNSNLGSIRYLTNNNAWSIFPDPDANSQFKLDITYHTA
jgi:hypothetical protein